MIANADLTAFADRLARCLDDLDDAKGAVNDLKTEIKSAGFDAAALTKVVEMRRDEAKRKRAEEQLQAITLYASRCGVQLELGL